MYFQWEVYIYVLQVDREVKLYDIDLMFGVFLWDIVIYRSVFDQLLKDEKDLYVFDNLVSKKEGFEYCFFYDF